MRYPLIAFSLLAALTGCDEDLVCTTEAAYSVNLTLTDANGDAVTEADIQYRVDDGALQACEEFGDGAYACGVEQSGSITVVVPDGTDTIEETYEVLADECHVIPQSDAIQLSA